jgi:SAM-dependent methyltransferase
MVIFQPDRYLLDKQIREVKHYITGKVLDVGAGEINRYSRHFSYTQYTRMDSKHADKVDLVGKAEKIPAPDESFDSVVCTQVFEHLEFPEESAKEIFRVLKSGGYLLITVPQMNELHEEPYDYWRYTKFGVRSLFEKAGFTTLEESQRGGYFATVAQMKIRYFIDRFSLYKRPFLGKILAPFMSVYGRLNIYLDSFDTSVANRKHTIGWCFVFKKKTSVK